MKETTCLKCGKKFEDVNFEKFGGNDLNIRTWCNECVKNFKINRIEKASLFYKAERRIQQ